MVRGGLSRESGAAANLGLKRGLRDDCEELMASLDASFPRPTSYNIESELADVLAGRASMEPLPAGYFGRARCCIACRDARLFRHRSHGTGDPPLYSCVRYVFETGQFCVDTVRERSEEYVAVRCGAVSPGGF